MDGETLLEKLNKEQLKAVTHGEGPLLIVAGAGTGKTTVITRRVAWLIQEERAKSDEILAVTFTDKAAGEMEERVDKLLPLGYLDLWISTFHSFCQRVLKDHALDIGLSNDFRLLDQTAQWMLVRQNLDKFNLDYYRPLGNPTKFIHALLKHFSRAKDEAVGPEEYLDYVEGLKLDQDVAESTGGGYKVKKNKSVISTEVEKSHKVKSRRGEISRQARDDILRPASSAGRRNSKSKKTSPQPSPSQGEGEIARLEEVVNAYHVYQKLLLDNDALDFGDLINYTLKLFKERPKILDYYRTKFKYILVDEFQDTNWAQYELIKLLTEPNNNLTVVGDDDQSIYKFRGASVSNILQFAKDFPKTEIISLTTNYRSKQKILDLSYKFIQLNNPNRLEAQDLSGKKVSKKLTAHQGTDGEVTLLKYSDHFNEAAGVVEKILELKEGKRIEGVKKVKEITSPQSPPYKGGDSWDDFAILVRANSQIDIFAGALEAAGIPYIHLTPKGLYTKPVIVDILSFLKLLDNYHESGALWRVLNWPVIDFAAKELVELNFLAKRRAWSLHQALESSQTSDNFSAGFKKQAKKILDLIESFTTLAKKKRPREVILTLLQNTGYLKWLAGQSEPVPTQSNLYLEQFDKKLQNFEAEAGDARVKAFLAEIDLERESGETGTLSFDPSIGPETLKLMTVHAAKGLEFKYVFVVNMVDKRFPTIGRRDSIELPDELIKEIIPQGDIHLEEERRLFYVAMTRAKESVYLTAAQDYGGKTTKKPSRFLHELGMVDSKSHSGAKAIESRAQSKELRSYRPLASRMTVDAKSFKSIDHKPFKFSYTQVKRFIDCPYQYYLDHVLRLPSLGKPQFSFGRTIHLTLQRFFQSAQEGGGKQADLFGQTDTPRPAERDTPLNRGEFKKIPELKELLRIYQETWIDDWYESASMKEDYRKRGESALREYYKIVEKNVPQVELLEKKFNFKLSKRTQTHSQRTQTHKDDEVFTITGIIDRVDRLPGGQIEIVDYKTGQLKTEKTADKNQLFIYQIAAEEILQEKVAKLIYWYIEYAQDFEFLGSAGDLEKLKGWLLETIDKIRTADWEKIAGEHSCRLCENRNI